jgi:hypothetical protein
MSSVVSLFKGRGFKGTGFDDKATQILGKAYDIACSLPAGPSTAKVSRLNTSIPSNEDH